MVATAGAVASAALRAPAARAWRPPSTWCCRWRRRRPGAELVEQVGQQLVMAVATAALRAPAAIGDPAVIRCWR
ncbi:hypothetical protein [Duganella sp. LjRoot269]|uniref:hypothetical protein n=1 Tax=Duganella sp. LjRoot269 TaxID=3342305 RepID=UPI003F4FB323